MVSVNAPKASLLLLLLVILSGFSSRVSATPASINSFPYLPNDTALASDFEADYGSGPTTSGSAFANGTISSPRQADGGTSVQAWANQLSSNYSNGTVRWLHSPIFDLSAVTSLSLNFYLWIDAESGNDGMKMQVSTNGGSTWTDVTGTSVAYNGNTSTSGLLNTHFGGSNNCWTGTALGGGSANACSLDLSSWTGQADVRFRWCFVSNGSTNSYGPVLDKFEIVFLPVTATVTYGGGYVAIPQASTQTVNVSKSGGAPFASGMTLGGFPSGLSGSITSVTNADNCVLSVTATRVASVGPGTFFLINAGGYMVCSGTVDVFYPQQLIPSRQGGSALEPPQGAAMGANSVYLHNGEFRHDLPLVSIPGRMLPLGVGITYRSQAETIGALGAGWTASFDKRINYHGGSDTIDLYSGDGRIDTFALQAGGSAGVGPYVLAGFFLTITRDDLSTPSPTDDVFTIHCAHGSSATYAWIHRDVSNQEVYRETAFADRYGNTVASVYNAYGQITELRGDLYSAGSPSRYKLVFGYNSHGRLEDITDYADYTGQSGIVGGSYTGNRVWEFDYNSSARLTEIRLPQTERYYSNTQGSTFRTRVQFTYDSNDNMIEVIDARQANETSPYGWLKNHYDGSDLIDYQDVGRTSSGDTSHRQYVVYSSSTDVSVVNAMSYRSRYRLNADGTPYEIWHYTGIWSSGLSLTPSSQVRVSDPTDFVTAFVYDAEFNTIEVTNPRGNVTQFFYDIANGDQRSRGNLLRVLALPGSISTSGLPSDQVYGLLSKFSYTSAAQFNLLETSVGPRAFELDTGYDITVDDPLDYIRDDSAYFTTTYTYTFGAGAIPDGTLASVTSPAVDTTRSPDTLNNTQYLETTFTYNFPYGQLLTSTDQAGVETTYVYGTSGFGKGLLEQVQVGTQTMSPLITQFTYNSVGRMITVEDPRTNTFISYVNQLDQVMRSETPTVNPASVVYYTETEFDLNGNVEASKICNIDEAGVTGTPSMLSTTYTYNILDMAESVTEPIAILDTRTTSFTYDLIYRLDETTLPEGNQSSTDYDELNRSIKSYFGYDTANVAKGSASVQSEVYYDENSNVIKTVDGNANFSQYTYNCYDRCTKAEDRIPSTPNYTEFTHDQAGAVTLSVRKGLLRTFSGTFTSTSNTELGRAETRYDNIGRAYFSRVKAKNNDLTTSLGYSGYETVPGGASDGWSTSRVRFAANGLVEQTESDLRYPTTYSYDSFNRIYRVTDDRDGGGSDDNFDEYGYDANGNVTSIRAVLFDDRGSPGDKDVTTFFYYDEINRLIQDESPSVNGSPLYRYYSYDSRSLLIDSTDRKGQVRHHEYDFLGRMTRQRAYVSMREIDASTGYVSIVTNTVASRAVYDENSNVVESIDPTGNRTYMRYDMAGRWVQTQHADGGIGTALKTSAGTSHSVTQYPGTNFWYGTSDYDGNSNLLNMKDENNTVRTWTYDENDKVLTEDGTPAGGNPFNIEGEEGSSYLYDGMYRSIYGETHDGTGTLTDTESVYNTLGGLERQRQQVMRAHPSALGYTDAGDVVSEFDESGRRFSRTNPGDVTRTTWEFDRKHRPSAAWLEHNVGGWTGAFKISEYKYLGGGLLHSQHTKYMTQPMVGGPPIDMPIISDFERDDLLRLTSVRHWRDDAWFSPGDTRLLGRYDYLYDENSMMRYEARWHEEDFAATAPGASTVPEETDFYFYSSDNQLEKVDYNVTLDRGGPIDLSSMNWGYFDDDVNYLNCTDRVTYGRRVSGTRQKVNWYRGQPTRTTGASPYDETAGGPDQKTNYDTTDDPGADDLTPAADGDGSRHNYTVIGQTGLTYDNNRNVLADGTREFRYSYNNQLRRVWRKSDGSTDGLLAVYREDAYGRRVYAESYWELSRRDVLDTRFSVDINMDEDGDSTILEYVDGGITSTQAAPLGYNDQIAAWDSRIRRSIGNTNETHYFDFDVTVPDIEAEKEYLGFVAYDTFELWIYTDRYELWDTTGPSLIGACTMTTAGRHNIGLRAGPGWGVWVDGSQLTLTGGSGSMGLISAPKARFGTHDSSGVNLILWENLCYLKSYYRANPDASIPSDGVVNVTNFDGPRPAVVKDVYGGGSAVVNTISVEGGDRHELILEGAWHDYIELPNGRMHTGIVVTTDQDQITYTTDGTRIDFSGDVNPVVGVILDIHLAGDGAITPFIRGDPTALLITPYTTPTTAYDWHGSNNFLSITVVHGETDGGEGDESSFVVSSITGLAAAGGDTESSATFTADRGQCACRAGDPSLFAMSAGTTDPCLGLCVDFCGGNATDRGAEVQLCGDGGVEEVIVDPPYRTWTQDGQTWASNDDGKTIHRVIDPTKMRDVVDKKGKKTGQRAIELTDNLEETTVITFAGLRFMRSGSKAGCNKALDILSTVLDLAGLVPVVGEGADLANSALAEARGDDLEAVLNLISAIPGAGDAFGKVAKYMKKLGQKVPWGKIFNGLYKMLGECGTSGPVKEAIKKAIKNLAEALRKRGVNVPEGLCFVRGTPVAAEDGDKAIEEIDVGDRVLTPETLAELWTHSDVDSDTWRRVVLELANPDCPWDIYKIVLLRSLDWISEHRALCGSDLTLVLDDMGVRGTGHVLAIQPCPQIKKGRGRIVTGTVTHLNGYVCELRFNDGSQLCPTDLHPLYSLSRGWIRTGDVAVGEQLRTAQGVSTVVKNSRLDGVRRVYNLEVEGEHAYFAGRLGVLVHNNCTDFFEEAGEAGTKGADDAGDAAKAADAAKNAGGTTPDDFIKGTQDAKPKSGPGSRSNSDLRSKSGGMDQADKDFDDLAKGQKVTTHPNGTRSSTLPDGTKINVRSASSDGRPTVEITKPDGSSTKVRYDP